MLQVSTVGLHQSFLFRSDQQVSVRQVLYDARDDKKGGQQPAVPFLKYNWFLKSVAHI
jgi:hypothetical protein